MEILIAVLLLAIIAALALAWTNSRRGAAHDVRGGRAGGVRGRRRAALAAREDPMAEAVERHSLATDPNDAAEEELRLRAEANRVASELHAREAAALESEADAAGPRDRAGPIGGHGRPLTDGAIPAYEDDPAIRRNGVAYLDEQGRPVREDDRPRY